MIQNYGHYCWLDYEICVSIGKYVLVSSIQYLEMMLPKEIVDLIINTMLSDERWGTHYIYEFVWNQ